jgi:hypothetical protein
MSFGSTLGRIGFGLATGGLSELPGAIDKYVTHGTENAGKAAAAQRSALDAAMKRLQEVSQQQYAGRMGDLDKTLAFYGPAQRYLQSIYAQPSAFADNGGAAVSRGAPSGFGAPPPGPPASPPGFPKGMFPDVPGYGQGPRRGF